MKLKNIFIRFLLIGIVLLSLNGSFCVVYATETVNYSENTDVVITRAEVTKWYIRIVDGRPQQRLWSETYGKWLTEWEWV